MDNGTGIKLNEFVLKDNLSFMVYAFKFEERFIYDLYKLTSLDYYKNIYTNNLGLMLCSVFDDYLSVNNLSGSNKERSEILFCSKPNGSDLLYVIDMWLQNLARKYKNPDYLVHIRQYLDETYVENHLCSKDIKIDNPENDEGFIYNSLPHLLLNKLVGERTEFKSGFATNWHYVSAKKDYEIISDLKEDKGPFAMAVSLKIMLKPGSKKYFVQLCPHIKRFVDNYKNPKPYLKNNINTLVSLGQNKNYVSIPFGYCSDSNTWLYNSDKLLERVQDMKLPDGDEYLNNIQNYVHTGSHPQILAPLTPKLQKDLWINDNANVGVPINDEKEIYEIFRNELKEYVDETDWLERTRLKHRKKGVVQKPKVGDSPVSPETGKQLRDQLLYATYGQVPTFNIMFQPVNTEMAEIIKSRLKEYFNGWDDLKINLKCDTYGLMDPIKNDNVSIENRVKAFKSHLNLEPCSGTIVILNGPDYYKKLNNEMSDPKKAIRLGLAAAGSISQFITPENFDLVLADYEKQSDCKTLRKSKVSNFEHKVEGTICDLLRQFGLLIEYKPSDKIPNHPVIGLDFLTFYIKSKNKNKKTKMFMFVTVEIDINSGTVQVNCPEWSNQKMPYYEFLTKLAIFSSDDKKIKTLQSDHVNTIKNTLFAYQKKYKKNEATLLFHAYGQIRNIKAISQISDTAINSGSIETFWNEFKDSKLNILRIRCASGGEVPTYFTEEKVDGEYGSHSGLFKEGDVCYVLSGRPYKKPFTDAFKSSQLDGSTSLINKKGLIEYFPLVLSEGSSLEDIVSHVNSMRENAISFNADDLNLPLPLHLLKLSEEYISIVDD